MLLGMPQNRDIAVTRTNGRVLPGDKSLGSSLKTVLFLDNDSLGDVHKQISLFSPLAGENLTQLPQTWLGKD
jgi:hypothetical protein